MIRGAVIVAALSAFALTACMEVEQGVSPQQQGRYQGKPDTNPWDNEPRPQDPVKWTKGDRASWETQIRTRQMAQHEHRRIYQQ